jgi:hypothetical protein
MAPAAVHGSMMRVRVMLATEPGKPDWPNEDFAAVTPGAAVLLDGVTCPDGADTGCVHDVAWYARMLGGALLAAITADPPAPLRTALAAAITEVRALHGHTCDLANPATPRSTVTAVRAGPAGFDVLALGDSSFAADYADGRPPFILTDTQRGAAASTDAADRARTQTLPGDGLRGVALLSDGATRITDIYGLATWPDMLAVIREQGPAELIRQVRAAEASDPDQVRWPRGKLNDDTTVVYWHQTGAPS